MPRITAVSLIARGTVRTGIAGFVCAALSLGALTGSALLGTAPAAQAADLYGQREAGGSDAPARRTIALARRGNAHAQAMLGFMYANGHGVPQSYELAVAWYAQAAGQGDPNGQYLLGLMYDKGFGVNADVVLAHKWLNLAAAHAPRQNRENFLRMRDAVGTKMTRAQLDLAQQLAVEFVPSRP